MLVSYPDMFTRTNINEARH